MTTPTRTRWDRVRTRHDAEQAYLSEAQAEASGRPQPDLGLWLVRAATAAFLAALVACLVVLWPGGDSRPVAPAAPRPVDTARAACLLDQGSGGVWVETAQGRHACLEPGNVGALLLGLTARGTGQ